MQTEHPQITRQQAREQLAVSVHAVATAVLGLSLGLYLATRNVVEDGPRLLMGLAFVAFWLAAIAGPSGPLAPSRAAPGSGHASASARRSSSAWCSCCRG